MEAVLLSLALLACPVGMGVMMWAMARANRKAARTGSSPDELKAEHARITQEIDELEGQRHPGPVGAVRA